MVEIELLSPEQRREWVLSALTLKYRLGNRDHALLHLDETKARTGLDDQRAVDLLFGAHIRPDVRFSSF
jgi:hypothetical protein